MVYLFTHFGYLLLLNLIRNPMKLRYYTLLFLLFSSSLVFAQNHSFDDAQSLFDDGKYSAAQALLNQLSSGHSANAEAMFLNAKCSKALFLSDAELLYEELNEYFPYHQFKQEVNADLALINYRKKDYSNAISYFLELDSLSNEFIFKLAYASFSIDSLVDAQYYFSKLIGTVSKYSSTAQYYYAYIAYERGFYKSALVSFNKLLNDEKFGNIVPYYISQIYFFQKEYKQLIAFAKPLSEKVIASRKSEVNRLLAEAYFRTKDFENAIIHFEVFLEEEKEGNSVVHFLLGQAYYNSKNYLSAISSLEKVSNSADSLMQNSAYFLGASYLMTDNMNYALQAFKKSSEYNYNPILKEEAFYNYAKLSFQLELPFENTLAALKTYLESYNNPLHKKIIEDLMVKSLQSTSQYSEAYNALVDIHLLTNSQQIALQQLAFFLGVKEYNQQNFKDAISYFIVANRYPINDDYSYLTNYWLADCYFQLSDFDKSIAIYSDLSVSSNKNLSDYESLKSYNLAYSYFQNADYSNAIKWFRTYEKTAIDSMKLNDTYFRIADGYFMSSDFSLAQKYYNKAIAYNLFDVDYGIYKRSVSLGLIGKNKSKVKLLKQIIADYSASSYYDNSLYDLAKYYKNTQQNDLAIKYYDDLLIATKDENLIADAYLSKGMIYFNSSKTNEAIVEFLFVVNNYQQTIYFKEAISGLQAAYSSLAQIDKYLAVIESLPSVSISRAEQDSLTYNAAFMKFSELEYKVAKKAFDKYLSTFENGIFVNDATYYNAISAVKINDSIAAITLYEKVVELGVKSHQETAMLFLARESYSRDDFVNSNKHYNTLLEYASSNSIKREVVIRLMTGNEMIDNKVAFKFAKQVVEFDKTDNWLLSKAYVIIARNEFENGNYAKSKVTFKQVVGLSDYDEGAEAKYYLAYLTYLDENLTLAEQMIFELAEKYSSDYFIAKAFILLADIYVAQENNFQAKATLESIIENHDGDDLVNLARKKWEQIVEKEKVVTPEVEEEFYIDISEDEIVYEEEVRDEIDEDYIVEIPDSLKVKSDSLEIKILEDEEIE